MTTKNDCKCNHEFVLVLSGVNTLDDEIANALLGAGCDDATISLRFGTVYLSFDREASSLQEAILSAIQDVSKAGIGASVKYVDSCNLVTQSDIARRIGRSRQLVGQYISGKRGPGNFPGPTCGITEVHPLWMWCEVSYWLFQNGIVGEDVLKESRIVAGINSALDLVYQWKLDPALLEQVFEITGVTALSDSL